MKKKYLSIILTFPPLGKIIGDYLQCNHSHPHIALSENRNQCNNTVSSFISSVSFLSDTLSYVGLLLLFNGRKIYHVYHKFCVTSQYGRPKAGFLSGGAQIPKSPSAAERPKAHVHKETERCLHTSDLYRYVCAWLRFFNLHHQETAGTGRVLHQQVFPAAQE